MKTPYVKAVDNAIRKAKKHFGECIISTTQQELEGAHVFPRSTHKHLADVPQNIVPLTPYLHAQLDKHQDGTTRRPAERIVFLRQKVNSEHRAALDAWLIELLQVIAAAA